MKIIEFIKKYQLILMLVLLVIILIVLKLVYGNENKNQTSNLSPTPTVISLLISPKPTEISYEVLNDGNPDYPLQKLLPYSTDNFKIIGYDEPYTLVVKIKSGTKEENEKEIKQWIDKNFSGNTDHKIIFTK